MENTHRLEAFRRSLKVPKSSAELLGNIKVNTKEGTKNFYKAYAEIALVLEENPEMLGVNRDDPDYEKTKTWFERAAEINSDDPKSSANKFIRAVSKYGLHYSGKSLDIKDETGMDGTKDRLDETTKIIGRGVVSYVIKKLQKHKYEINKQELNEGGNNDNNLKSIRILPGISEIINAEIDGALKEGEQDLAGWGGAFYFWDHKLKSGETIGETIKQDPEQLEKFLAINAAATRYTMKTELKERDSKEFFEGILFGVSAPIPLNVRKEITSRVRTKNYTGNPQKVDGWIFSKNNKWIREEWPPGRPPSPGGGSGDFTNREILADSYEATELNLRRNARLKYQNIDFDSIDVLGNKTIDAPPVHRNQSYLDQINPENFLPENDDLEFWSGKKSDLGQGKQEDLNHLDRNKEQENLGFLNGFPRNSLMSSQINRQSKSIQ
ncbi:hypothetical protein WH95_00510 [Kiloniella litopenaei]|uniref:Uncharacterized protein n=1 Tax=Kiloniella litopenaei TaxID=1549748 RepID=A0A0M2RGC3_9PROT|nr:hypothetical protein [Kiloniella litopenaei]KKJ78618.1 hypothetical protein WH95_00510 [Kiloniella litopenaei]